MKLCNFVTLTHKKKTNKWLYIYSWYFINSLTKKHCCSKGTCWQSSAISQNICLCGQGGCPSSFTTFNSYRKHLLNQHPQEEPEPEAVQGMEGLVDADLGVAVGEVHALMSIWYVWVLVTIAATLPEYEKHKWHSMGPVTEEPPVEYERDRSLTK